MSIVPRKSTRARTAPRPLSPELLPSREPKSVTNSSTVNTLSSHNIKEENVSGVKASLSDAKATGLPVQSSLVSNGKNQNISSMSSSGVVTKGENRAKNGQLIEPSKTAVKSTPGLTDTSCSPIMPPELKVPPTSTAAARPNGPPPFLTLANLRSRPGLTPMKPFPARTSQNIANSAMAAKAATSFKRKLNFESSKQNKVQKVEPTKNGPQSSVVNGLKPSSADASGVSLSTSNSVPSQTALSRPTASHTSATMTNVTATTGTPYAGTTLKKDFKAPPPMTNQPKRIFPRRIPGRASASRSSSISADHDDTDDDDSNGMSASRFDSSLNVITKKFFELFKNAPDGIVDLNEASSLLKVPKRRIYDITNVLEGIGLTKKKSKNRVEWINKEGSAVEDEDPSDEDRALNNALEEIEKVTLDLFRAEKRNLYTRPDFLKEVDSLHSNTIICVKKRADTKLIVYPSDPKTLTVGTTADYTQQLWLVPTFLWPGWRPTEKEPPEDLFKDDLDVTLVSESETGLDNSIMDLEVSMLVKSEDDEYRLNKTLDISSYSECDANTVFNESMFTISELSQSTCGAGHSQMDSDYSSQMSQVDFPSSPSKYWPLPASPGGSNFPPELLAMEPFEGFDFMFGMEFSEEGFADMFGI